MNELLDQLKTSHISLDELDIVLKHPHYCELRKRTPEICNQEKRRAEWLENIKSKREQQLNTNRGIKSKSTAEAMDVEVIKKKTVLREYKGWLMLSEWLIDVPSDIEENWICAICPEGTRAIVVAEKGKTMAYRRNGRTLCVEFPCWLPGGSTYTYRGETILDTVFHRSSNVFYVLDVLHWGIDTLDFEAEMRFFWLQNKLQETSVLKDKFKSNRYKFIPVEHFQFKDLKEKMKQYPAFPANNPKVDGILFYHRQGTYVQSRTPLVTWLNPFMLPDILGIEVAPQYLEEKPAHYNKMEVEVQG